MSKEKIAPFSSLGADRYSKSIRAKNDYYSTDPLAITILHKSGLLDKNQPYWETAVGGGHLSEELKRLGYNVTKETDLYDRGYGESGVDFFKCNEVFKGNTLTNPPYNRINDWIVHSLEVTENKVYIFAKIQTIETIKRYKRIFRDNPPVWICPSVKRIYCYNEGITIKGNSAICYAWFIWDNKDDTGETRVKWLI